MTRRGHLYVVDSGHQVTEPDDHGTTEAPAPVRASVCVPFDQQTMAPSRGHTCDEDTTPDFQPWDRNARLAEISAKKLGLLVYKLVCTTEDEVREHMSS
jgi:hypothetical protein